MALKRVADTRPVLQLWRINEQEGMGLVTQPVAQACVKQLLVHILVVVANIQMRTLKTEVGKVSM